MPESATSTLRSQGDLTASLDGVTFGFSRFGDAPIISNLSISIAHGQLVAIVGRSGVGKTTLLRLFAGLAQPATGVVSQPKRIAYVPQELGLFGHKTVLQNVELADQIERSRNADDNGSSTSSRGQRAKITTLRAVTALTELEIAQLADRFPHELSGGQQQRVVLARAVAMRAALLLCDEPFSALDDRLRADSRLLLRKVAIDHETTTVLVTHNLNDAIDFADRVLVVSGRPVEIAVDVAIGAQDRVDPTRRANLVADLRGAM